MIKNGIVMMGSAIFCLTLLFGCTNASNGTSNPKTETDAHQEEGLSFEIHSPNTEEAGLETDFDVVILKDGHPLTNADVGFEFWKEGGVTHHFVAAKESQQGHYKALLNFQTAGKFTVKIHVEKGKLHGHKEDYFTVK
ncbi:FixH family protein [Bacillus sp. V5-8f]|uniref:FixH family protein n=1 Tax=Bacillus sp. V5-8f TaxID=2053044 RepID=UPI000C78EC44|nr:FixH family protein [Bacillus sp. V5-8f]PLT32004.1 hypothetical protein CUU64_20690 [Bacillus sp. V5-8f]